MKKLIILLSITLFSTQIFGQTEKLNQLFDKYQESDGVTSIKIAKPMFNLLNKLNIDDNELDKVKPLLSKINGLKILIVEPPVFKGKTPQDSIKILNDRKFLQSEILSSVSKLNYQELMTVNSHDNKIKFLAADTNSSILDNLLLSINSGTSNILMMLDGKISMDDINSLINEEEKPKSTPKK